MAGHLKLILDMVTAHWCSTPFCPEAVISSLPHSKVVVTEYDIVVVGRTQACQLTCQEAKDGLFHLFRRASILKKPAGNMLRQGRNDHRCRF